MAQRAKATFQKREREKEKAKFEKKLDAVKEEKGV
jgi:hypothetical protein